MFLTVSSNKEMKGAGLVKAWSCPLLNIFGFAISVMKRFG